MESNEMVMDHDHQGAHSVEHKIGIFFMAIAVFGYLANAFVLFLMLKTKKIREHATNFFIIATLTLDMVIAIWFFVFMVIESDKKSAHLFEPCISLNCCFVLFLINLQVSMSLDRVYAVCFPMRYMVRKSNNYKVILIVLSFVVGLIGGSAHLVLYDYVHLPAYKNDIEEAKPKFVIVYSLWIFVSCLVIVISNLFILYAIKVRVSK